jgi:hypothetical protein
MVYAACGLILSLVVHAESFAGLMVGGDKLFGTLCGGMFPAFLSAVLIGRSEKNKKRGVPDREIDDWELLFAGGPIALKYLFWGCFAYTWVSAIVLVVRQSHEPNAGGREMLAFCMTFYAMGLAAATAAWRRGRTR